VSARHPALPLMSMWVCRTIVAGVVCFAIYLLLMHWKLWSVATFWAFLTAPSVVCYLGWLFHSFRLSIKDDNGKAWIEPEESHMPYMPSMPPEKH
jgi:hypothetical protein